MKVTEKHSKLEREVYVIYWADFQGNLERYHCIISEDGYPGLLSVPESECDLVDPNVNNFVLTNLTMGRDVFMHPVLANDKALYARLIDHDPDAMEAFINKLSASM